MGFDTLIHAGILFLLVYLPVAFGGVTEYAAVVLEIVTGVACLIWLLKVFVRRKHLPRGVRPVPHRGPRCYLTLTPVPGMLLLAGFLMFIAVQQIPLPAAWVQRLSPHTHALYAEAATALGHTLPATLPLSVNLSATRAEFAKYLAYGLIFFLLIQTLSTPRQIRRFHAALIGMGLLQAGYGIVSFITQQPLIVWYGHSGSYVNKNHFAGYLEMIILLGLGILFTRFEASESIKGYATLKNLLDRYAKTVIWLLVLFTMICALLLSQSRGGQLSFLGSTLIFMLLARSRRMLRKWNRFLSVFLIAVVALTLALTPLLFMHGLQRFDEDLLISSFQTRQEIWKIAWHIFRDFPLLGSGLGTFASLTRRYQHFRSAMVFVYTESDVLRVLSETGLLGFGLLMLAGGAYLVRVLRVWSQRKSRRAVALVAGGLSALSSLLLHGVVDFNLHVPANALTFVVIAALTYVTAFTREKARHV